MTNTLLSKFQAIIEITLGPIMFILATKMYLSRHVSNDKYLIAFSAFVLAVIVSAIWMKLRPILGLSIVLTTVSMAFAILLIIEFISSPPKKEMLQFILLLLISALTFSEGITTYSKARNK